MYTNILYMCIFIAIILICPILLNSIFCCVWDSPIKDRLLLLIGRLYNKVLSD